MIGEMQSRQILALSHEGLGPADISRELLIDEGLVKLCLGAYKEGSEEDRDINDAQLKMIRQKLTDLALGAQDEAVAAKCGMYLLDRDKPRKIDTGGVNIQAINIAIQAARQNFNDLVKVYQEKVIVALPEDKSA